MRSLEPTWCSSDECPFGGYYKVVLGFGPSSQIKKAAPFRIVPGQEDRNDEIGSALTEGVLELVNRDQLFILLGGHHSRPDWDQGVHYVLRKPMPKFTWIFYMVVVPGESNTNWRPWLEVRDLSRNRPRSIAPDQ
jgi:hypothetical protein